MTDPHSPYGADRNSVSQSRPQLGGSAQASPKFPRREFKIIAISTDSYEKSEILYSILLPLAFPASQEKYRGAIYSLLAEYINALMAAQNDCIYSLLDRDKLSECLGSDPLEYIQNNFEYTKNLFNHIMCACSNVDLHNISYSVARRQVKSTYNFLIPIKPKNL